MPMQPMITGRRHMIVAGHYLAAEAGARILEAGGNAIDAGVAAGLALEVVHSDQVQFSGVAPMLVYSAAEQRVRAIAGLGPWPAASDAAALIADGAIPLGVRRTVVPAAPDAWITALARFGTIGFGDAARDAIRYAREGFTMHPVMAHFIARFQDNYRRWPQNAAIWLPGGQPPAVGDLFVQADLAGTLQFMADQERAAGGDRAAGLAAARHAFYEGDIAAAILAHYREHDGWLSAADLADYRSPLEAPQCIDFRGIDVYSCGPWCQGPVLLQALRLLDGFDLTALGQNSADYVHIVAEALKLAFADRETFYGDPDRIAVPMAELLGADYAATRRQRIDLARAWPGMPPAGEIAGHGGVPWRPALAEGASEVAADTSYVCVVDAEGNVFSATPSDVSFEGPAIPGLGFCPSSRGSQSFAQADHASAVAPGKRPRLTPNPAMALAPGRFAMSFGGPGGDAQPQGMLQVLLNHVVFGMDIQEAVEAPRFTSHSHPNSFEPHAYAPARLSVEAGIGDAAMADLAARGHDIEPLEELSLGTAGVCAISADFESGLLSGGADPRRAARAIGW